jgi:hypothetical protein
MLEHHKHPFLLKSLYAVLMVLPPCRAYKTLQLRLKDISSLHKSLPTLKMEEPELADKERNEVLKQVFIQSTMQPKKVLFESTLLSD